MPYKDPKKYREYKRDYMRRRRKKDKELSAGNSEVREGAPPSAAPSTEGPPTSPAAVSELPREKPRKAREIESKVHLLGGSMGVFRAPKVVFQLSKQLLESQGWCVWRYPELENETFVILRDDKVQGYPRNLPTLTLNPDRTIEEELALNIPGGVDHQDYIRVYADHFHELRWKQFESEPGFQCCKGPGRCYLPYFHEPPRDDVISCIEDPAQCTYYRRGDDDDREASRDPGAGQINQ